MRIKIDYVDQDGSSSVSFDGQDLRVEIDDSNVTIWENDRIVGAVRALSWRVETLNPTEEELAKERALREQFPEL